MIFVFAISALALFGGESMIFVFSLTALTSFGGESMNPQPLYFDTNPINITAIAGETITLPCSMEFTESYKVGNQNNLSCDIRKHTFRHVRPAKIQISLRIRAV